MHHALEIEEILLNIFDRFCPPNRRKDAFSLAALARTCRTFKEPALDVLWRDLPNLSPLSRCLPEASRRVSRSKFWFRRRLTKTEWSILRGYATRIRSIRDVSSGLEEKFIRVLSKLPTSEPLFPNLRTLCGKCTIEVMPLLCLPIPSLMSLDITIDYRSPHAFHSLLKSFSEFSPNIRNLTLHTRQSDVTFNKLVSDCISQWRDLQTFSCPQITLNVDALVHLSRIPTLSHLDVTLNPTFPVSDSPLLFSSLRHLALCSGSYEQLSGLLAQSQLSAVAEFAATIRDCPSKQELSSFFASIQTSTTDHIIRSLVLEQPPPQITVDRSEALPLRLEDLLPCVAFTNLCTVKFRIGWNVYLEDRELLALASAWPHLEVLEINRDLGWNMLGASGMTPDGLVHLLQQCRSLRRLALVIDTRGYTEVPASGLLESAGFAMPCLDLDALDSHIEAESVQALSAFFAPTLSSSVELYAWINVSEKPPGWDIYQDRWYDVYPSDAYSGRFSDLRCVIA